MVRGLARRPGPPPHEGVPQQSRSRAPPRRSAPRRGKKKSPHLGTIADLCAAWAEGQCGNKNDHAAARALTQAAGSLRPHQLSEIIPRAIVDRWRARYTPGTAYGYTGALRRILQHIHSLGGPKPSLQRLRKAAPRETTATPHELHRLIQKAPLWFRLFILLCSRLGLRTTEAMSITTGCWNPEAHTITFIAKGSKPRTMPTTEEIEELLAVAARAQEPARQAIAILKGIAHVSFQQIDKAWAKAKAAANVNPNLTRHDLRRTVGTALYRETRDLRAVQQLLGHSSLHSTVTYIAPLDPGELHTLLEKLKPHTETKQ